jgi:glycosyltransferase involved in cell wall biosynthesis
MKILYITEIYPDVKHGLGVWGGGEKQFFEISKLVARRGHQVDILTCRFPGQTSEEFVEGVRVHRLGLTREPKTGGARRTILPISSYILKTASRAMELTPDLVHCNTYFPVYSGEIATQLRSVPLVSTFHDVYRLNEWVESQGSLIWGFLGHLATAVAARLPHDKIIVPSPQCRKKMIALGIRSEKIAVIANGVDLSLFDSVRAEKASSQILYVGRLTRLKCVDRLICAFAEVSRQVPETQLKIVGHGPEGANLRRLARRLKLQAKVIFTGVTPTYDAVARYFKESDVFVLPSRVEGESIAVKEAMAASLPVIAMKCGGSGVLSLVQDGENGFLVEPSQPTMLVDRMIQLLQDEKKRKDMGSAGRKLVEAYDWKAVADRTIQVYREVMQDRAARAAASEINHSHILP